MGEVFGQWVESVSICFVEVLRCWGSRVSVWCVGEKKTEFVGDGLLSHRPEPILPWALTGLTAGFEMGPGVPPLLISPTNTPPHT